MATFYFPSSSHFPQKKFLTKAQTSNCLNHTATASIITTPKQSNAKQSTHYNSTDEFSMKHEQKLEEVRNLLREAREDPLKTLVMIDDLQRLCIDYHFKEEIGHLLNIQHVNSSRSTHNHQNDLYEVSTRFRLLRQQGYYKSTDVFYNFKDKKGGFKAELRSNIRGLMSLYEASHLSIEGEDILDQAAEFSVPLLKRWMRTGLDQQQARNVDNTLRFPCHKSIPRFLYHRTVSDYKGIYGPDRVLQELAAMDFSMVQSAYRKEALRVYNWWEDRGFSKDLEFARDQPLKWYMCSVAVLTDPIYSDERVELTKPISLIYIIDDIFDVYGTVDQLTQFTEAVDKWDISATEQLPNCMKISFKALDEVTNEIANKVYKQHGWNPTYSLRRSWASLCNAFLIEAKWLATGEFPKAEEYLKNGVITSGVHVLLVHMFFLLGHGINEEMISLLSCKPGIITSTATILRLWDDFGSAKDENQEGRDGSYLECYMKEQEGISAECAKKQAVDLISKAWKNLNKECLSSHQFPETFRNGSLNIARMVPLMYSYDDNHKLPLLEEFTKSLLLDNLSL